MFECGNFAFFEEEYLGKCEIGRISFFILNFHFFWNFWKFFNNDINYGYTQSHYSFMTKTSEIVASNKKLSTGNSERF